MFSKELLNSDIFSLFDNAITKNNIEITATTGANVMIEKFPIIKDR